jgi:arylsulfatase A-like enzyme
MGKQNLYQHSLKVPFIVSGPNVEKQSSSKGNIYLLDLLPTLCDLANIEIPDSVDGKSFKQVLFGDQQTIRDVLYGAYSGGTKPGIRAVIKGDWKLIKYDVLEGKVRKNQLFNIKENPNELLLEHHQQGIIQLTGNKPSSNQINLAEDPKYSDKLKEMEKLLFSEMEKVGDPYRFWNQN